MFLQEHLAGLDGEISWFGLLILRHGSRTVGLWVSRIGDMFLQEHCGKLVGRWADRWNPRGDFLTYIPLLSLADASLGKITE